MNYKIELCLMFGKLRVCNNGVIIGESVNDSDASHVEFCSRNI